MTVVKSIELVIPHDVYTAGSNVDGQVILTLQNTLIDPTVRVELIGRGYLEWFEEDNIDKDYSRRATCINKADYVRRTKSFRIEGNYLDPGTHTFDFHFSLPPRIPSTFTSPVGRISYFVQASCATRELILAKETKYLQVQGTSLFRTEFLESEYPLVVEVKKILNYNCCFKSAPIFLKLSLVKNIFAPGDHITVTTQITNQTGKSIKKVIFALYSIVLYKAFNFRSEHRTLEIRDELIRLESNIDRGACEVTRIHSVLPLPKVMPVTSTQTSDDIMDVTYELTSTIHFPWCMNSVLAKIPIIVQNEAASPDE